jgi:hypothetical protein
MSLTTFANVIVGLMGLTTVAVGGALWGLSARSTDAPTVPALDNRTLCEEVAHAINEAYTDGLIKEEHARAIIDRCFESYPS